MIGSAPAAQEPSDAKLLDMVWAGDTEAFTVLYERHVAAARRLAVLLAGSPDEADEVVAETFAQVLEAARRGTFVSNAVRPYVLSALRAVFSDRLRGRVSAGEQQASASGEQFAEPALAGLRDTLARAYLSLPDNWQAVLWHTEVEQEAHADVARLLGVASNVIASLRRCAAEDLRRAYLHMHVLHVAQPECRPVAEELDRFVRDDLPAGEAAMVSDHLADCSECWTAYEELGEVNATLRSVVGRLVLGSAAAGYLGEAEHGPVSGPASGGAPPTRQRLRVLPRAPRTMAAIATLAAVPVIGLAVAFTLIGLDSTSTPSSGSPLPAAPSPLAGAPRPTPLPTAPSSAVSPSPRPSPSLSLTPSPSPPASTSSAPAAVSVRLNASISISAADNPFSPDQLVFQVGDTGSAASGPLTASVTLPAGTELLTDGAASGGWDCQVAGIGWDCTHSALSPGQDAEALLNFSPVCGPINLVATSGSATATAEQTVAC